ncbi:MAG TPA: dihydrolipoamide acetyltransferase family protein [Burkholderiaceae bacterium]|nr:dihydrolipoamide acetyltransferase family protein [Burkholderiaceae bacterium]
MSLLTALRIPHMGSVENAKLVSWRVAEGAAFKAGEPLYEIETDKTVVEVEAEADGVLARRDAAEGDEKKVGEHIGYVAPAGSSRGDFEAALRALDAEAAQPEAVAAPLALQPADATAPDVSARHSPLVRRLAAEHGVDLATLKGSGPGGRIVGDDVLRAAQKAPAAAGSLPVPPGYENVPVEAVPNSSRRRAISRRLLESARNTASLTADMQIDLTATFQLRAAMNERLRAKGDPAVSLLALIAHALCKVLRLRPNFNASFTDSHTLLWQAVNLGIAIDTRDGLIVPVIKDADKLSPAQIDAAIKSLAARARDNQLRPDELEGGTFTLSNPGSLGPVLRAEAIINPPQVALLGLPAVLRVPVAVDAGDGKFRVEVRQVIRPSLTFDHCALDGGQVIGFLNDLRGLLETAPAFDTLPPETPGAS